MLSDTPPDVESCATGSGHAAPKAVQGGHLAVSIEEWVKMVWPKFTIRKRTELVLALSRLETGYEIRLSAAGTGGCYDTPGSSPSGSARVILHGCNPYCLAAILQCGLLPSHGKQNCFGVWTSPWMHTAVSYPMEITDGVRIAENGPSVRIVLACLARDGAKSKRFPGRTNTRGLIVNEQIAWPQAQDLHVRQVHIVCFAPGTWQVTQGEQIGLMDERKFRARLRAADEMLSMHCIDLQSRDPPRRLLSTPARRKQGMKRGTVKVAAMKLHSLKRRLRQRQRHRDLPQ